MLIYLRVIFRSSMNQMIFTLIQKNLWHVLKIEVDILYVEWPYNKQLDYRLEFEEPML